MTDGSSSSTSAVNARWMLAAEAVQAAQGAVVLLGLFFLLDGQAFGSYAAALAVAAIVGIVCQLGFGVLLVRRASEGQALPDLWRQGVSLVLATSAVGIVVATVVSDLLLPAIPSVVLVLVGLTQAMFFWVVEMCVQVGVAVRRATISLMARSLFAGGRLVAIAALALSDSRSLEGAAAFVTVGSAVGAAGAVVVTGRTLGREWRPSVPRRNDVRDGLPYLFTDAALTFMSSIDRPILVRYGYIVENGDYTVAYRVVQICALPLVAMLRVADIDFFDAGSRGGVVEARRLGARFLARALPISVLLTGAALVGSVLVVPVLGDRLEDVAVMVRVLAWLPIVLAFQYSAASALLGARRMDVRNILLAVAAVTNLALNLWWVPEHGWSGAAASTLVAEGLWAVSMWAALWVLVRRARTNRELGVAARLRP